MRWTGRHTRVAVIAGAATAASGALELLYSELGLPPRPFYLSGVRPVEPWLAVSVIALGGCLCTMVGTPRAAIRQAVQIMATTILLAALSSLALHLSPNPGTFDALSAGRSLVASSLRELHATSVLSGFMLACAAAALLGLTVDRGRRAANAFAVVLVATGFHSFLWFLYDARPLLVTVSWNAALTPCIGGVGLLAACGSDAWPTRLFVERSARALLLRWLLPCIALVAVVTDFTTVFVFARYSSGLGSALNTMASIAIATLVISYLGRVIDAQLGRERAALAESEEKFRTVFACVPAGLSLTDFEDGHFVDVNDEFARIYGWSRKELVGHTGVERGIWDDQVQRHELLSRVVKDGGTSRDEEIVIRRRDGQRRTMRVAIRTLELHGRKVIVTASVDITGEKEAAAALRLSEEKFTTIFRESPLSLAVTEYESGRYVDVNEAFLKLTGAPSPEAVRGKTASELGLLSPEYRRAAVVSAVTDGQRHDMLVTGTRFNGERYTGQLSVSSFEHEGKRFLLGGMIDLTERERAERERLRAEHRFRALIEGVRDIVLALSPAGNIISLNPAFERITGMPTLDWLGRPFDQLVHPDDVSRTRDDMQAAALGGSPNTESLRIATSDKTYRTCEVSWAPHLDDGRIVSVFGIARDVSVRVSLEEQLRQSQKMEAVGQLAGGIAHDFNNLLNVIVLSGELILMSLPRDLTERKDIEQILHAAQRAAELTRQLLAFSRRQLLEPRDLDLSVIVGNMRRMLERVLGEHIELREEQHKDLGVVRVDASQMEQVIMNLVVNARDAMPEGGLLTLTTTDVLLDEATASKHPGAHAGRYVVLSVSDTGTGMTAEVKARIFEPFFTTKGVGKGTGLGLSTVFGIVQQSGGFIAVDSTAGRGTRFDVYLPRVEPSAVVEGEPIASGVALDGTETILLTEDNPILRALMAKVLRRHGYAVLEAGSAEVALQLAARHPGTIDLLVTDVVMPGMHGRTLADALVRSRPELKVLFASGHSDDVIAEQGVLAPGVVLLRKPFSPDDLARKVRDLLLRSSKRPSATSSAASESG